MIDADRLRSMFLGFFADGGHAILPSASLIAEVGDATHLACFEMLGNWSPGAYFERESITWSHDFLTRDDLLAIPPRRLWISVFAGNQATPADGESAGIWRALGSPPSDQNSTSATGALDAEPGTLPDQPGYDSSALSMRLRATWR